MKAVILAGGLGTRLAEETTVKPKPMPPPAELISGSGMSTPLSRMHWA